MKISDPVARLTLAPGEISFYRDHGFLVIPGLVPEATAAQLRTEVLDIMARIGLGMDKLKQTTEYLADSWIDALVNSPNLRHIAEQLLEGPATCTCRSPRSRAAAVAASISIKTISIPAWMARP